MTAAVINTAAANSFFTRLVSPPLLNLRHSTWHPVCGLQHFSHEDAVRVFDVVGERAAVGEAVAGVQLPGGLEGFGRARLQTQTRVAAARGLFEDVLEEARGDSLS